MNVPVQLSTKVVRNASAGKINARWVGNYNAHIAAYPEVELASVQRRVRHLAVVFNEPVPLPRLNRTTTLPNCFVCVARFNTILIDFGTVTSGVISPLTTSNRKPSPVRLVLTTMPHKVNPIDFENSEGNLGLSNAVLQHLASKLPVSPLAA